MYDLKTLFLMQKKFLIYQGDLTNRNSNKCGQTQTQNENATDPQPVNSNSIKDEDQISAVYLPNENLQLANVKKTERSKIFGSLPNHLDSDDTYRENRKLWKMAFMYQMNRINEMFDFFFVFIVVPIEKCTIKAMRSHTNIILREMK